MNNDLKLIFECDGEIIKKYAFKRGSEGVITLGRGQNCDVTINDRQVSSTHAQIVYDGTHLFVQDLGSSNGTYVNNKKLDHGQSVKIVIGDKIRFSTSNKSLLSVIDIDGKYIPKPGSASKPAGRSTSNLLDTDLISLFKGKNKIVIGRDKGTDVILDHPQVSRKHCSVERKSDGSYLIKDLSTNGTFVNGKKINSYRLKDLDKIMIGPFVVSLKGKVQNLSKKIAIKAEGIVKMYSNGYIGLNKCSYEIPSGSLIAIMGPSGCGKTTLLKTLNGESPATEGKVELWGLELKENYQYLKTQIGYVPQDDIVHRELTVQQSLYYAAKLRLENRSDTEIYKKIDQILASLNILNKKLDKISDLSGGQRKRVSIAVELLTDPMILFLDEPTSPLDPETIEEFLKSIKILAENGTTVVMVTHKPEDLNYMDSVIFLAEGGHFVYHGPSHNYTQYFDVTSPVQVYTKLKKENSSRWIDRYKKEHPGQTNSIVDSSNISHTPSDPFKQFFWLSARYLRIKTNDKVNSAILVFQAPIIALLICLIFDQVSQAVPFMITISALWFGTNNAAREIVGELPIYKRERMFNIQLIPYIFSKLSVMMLFAFIQAFLFTSIIMIRYKWHGEGPEWNEFLSTLLWMVYVSSSATLMGLLLSALVDTTEKVMSIVPISLIPQIMLAGIVAKITTPAVEILSYLTLARWGTEGLSNIQETVYSPIPAANDDGTDDHIVDAVEKLNMQFHEGYEDTFGEMASELSLDIIAIGLLSLLFFIGIYMALKKKDAINQ